MNIGVIEASATGTHELKYDREFGVTPDKLFAAWTDPALMAGWWGPQGMETPKPDLDVREGGKWRTVMQNAGGDKNIVGGEYKKIDPPTHLSFTWAWESDGIPKGQSLIEIDFEATSGGTMMHFRQSGFDTSETAGLHNQGWTSSFVCLSDLVATGGLA